MSDDTSFESEWDDETKRSMSDIPMDEAAPQDAPDAERILYARKKTIKETEWKTIGAQFAPDFDGACKAPSYTQIQKQSIIKMEDVGKCNTGDVVTRFTTH